MTNHPPDPGNTFPVVKKISDDSELELGKKIRYEVFVIGQNVPANEEFDKFEGESRHFLALLNDTPAGAARWRFTEKGIKLERFAVLEEYRGIGVGSALVQAVLSDIEAHPESKKKKLYLHAQISAVKLYQKYGFRQIGEMFQECDINHFKMIK